MNEPVYLKRLNPKHENCKYWWNLFSFDVYCAYREGNREKYDEAMRVLRAYQVHILERYPTLLYTLKQPVEWS